jgi:hypothetical protein
LKIYFMNLDQLMRFPIHHFRLNNYNLQKLSYPRPFLYNHTHMITLHSSLPKISFIRLLRIQIDMRIYIEYKWQIKACANGQIYLWRSYTSLLGLLYIWESTKSLKLRCIGIQTLIKVLYTQYRNIYHFVALNRSNDIAISLALRVTKETDITYLLIRSGGIR